MPFSLVRASVASIAAVVLIGPQAYAAPNPISSFELSSRDLQTAYQGLPECDSQGTDPSWAKGASHYKDGDGRKIGDQCDNGMGGDSHCWTDYFIVETTSRFNNWYQAVGDIKCSGDCAQDVGNLDQKCTQLSFSGSAEVRSEIDFELVKLGSTLSGTVGTTQQWCNTKVTTDHCTWKDNACHSIWAAQQVKTLHGYKRRSCKTPASAAGINMPNTPKRPDGYYTRGMQDFDIDLPSMTSVDCTGTCDKSWTPGPLPQADPKMPVK